MDRRFFIIAFFLIAAVVLTFFFNGFAQRPPLDDGRQPEWVLTVDVNKNGRIEQEEYRAAADAFFKKFDKNANGVLEETELPAKPREGRPPMPLRDVPPFLFLERGDVNLTREQFDEKANFRFLAIDVNGDRAINFEEIKNVRPPDNPRPPPGRMAELVSVQWFFGNKIIKNAPFSAETVREETKRLFDGSLVKHQSRGAVYRDGAGRVRHEQPFEFISGIPVTLPDNAPKKIVNIRDDVSGFAYTVDDFRRQYRKIQISPNPPIVPLNKPEEGKIEALGKQMIEGVIAEGTRTTLEIPAGQIGNDKTIYVISEKWFSPELQMVVLSKHTDPFAGEVSFRLVNIKLGEPSPDLFKVPADYELFQPNRKPNNDGTYRKGKKPM